MSGLESKGSVLTSVTVEGPVHRYGMNLDGCDVLVRDTNGDGILKAGIDEFKLMGTPIGRRPGAREMLSKAQGLVTEFREGLPEKLNSVRGDLKTLLSWTTTKNNMCVPVFVEDSRTWEWTLPQGESASSHRGIVSVLAYDHNVDGKIDEIEWKEADGLLVNIRAWRHVFINRRPHVDECDLLDEQRAGVEGALALFDDITSYPYENEKIIAIFGLSVLSFQEFTSKAIWDQHLHADDMEALAEEAAVKDDEKAAEKKRAVDQVRRNEPAPNPRFSFPLPSLTDDNFLPSRR
jgi:hypothetical protein